MNKKIVLLVLILLALPFVSAKSYTLDKANIDITVKKKPTPSAG